MGLCSHQIWYSLVQVVLRNSPDEISAGKWAGKTCSVINNSATDRRVLLKFHTLMLVRSGWPKAAELRK